MLGMARYPDKHFDLAIVDPPYGIKLNKVPGKRTHGFQQYIKRSIEWDNERPGRNYFTELRRISKEQIIWGANYFVEHLQPNSAWIVWDKVQPEGISFSMHELAYYSGPGPGKIFRKTLASTVNRATNRLDAKKYERIHPTQKPIELYKWLLHQYAKPLDRIIDTHMGSQSSRIAAFNMGFDYWGWEIDKEYFEAGNKRFKEQTAQLKLL